MNTKAATRTSTPARMAAIQIVNQMSADDLQDYTPAGWRNGVSDMLQGEWAGLDLDEVMAEINSIVPYAY